MEPIRPPENPLFDLWMNTQVNAATMDTLMRYIAELVAQGRGVTYEAMRAEMEADRDRRVAAYLRENRTDGPKRRK